MLDHWYTVWEVDTDMQVDLFVATAGLSERERHKLQRKLDKVERVLSGRRGLQAHAKLFRQRHLCEAEVTLRALRHTLVVTGTGMSDFAALHAALEKLERQALRNKRKIIDTHRPGRQRDRPSPLIQDSMHRTEVAASTGPEEAVPRPSIVPSRGTESKPMTAEEALMMLEDGKRQYVAYRDADTDRVNVLIRRPDGVAELVEGS